MKLFLVGYMGCGKSSLGRKLARHLQARFLDTDTLVEEREGASAVDIFRFEGEARFRAVECEVLDEAVAQPGDAVISTGGGLPLYGDNMARMNQAGLTIYLRRSAESIARRLSPYGRQRRPRLRGLSDEELVGFMTRDMAVREPFYCVARVVVDCDAFSDGALVERIAALVAAENRTTEKTNDGE